ncbi:hypothetical protein OG985_47000 [Streptomyces sp. NBC_00289]
MDQDTAVVRQHPTLAGAVPGTRREVEQSEEAGAGDVQPAPYGPDPGGGLVRVQDVAHHQQRPDQVQ